MISHKHKFIFIHIPKCAGSSIEEHFFEGMSFNWRKPNYEKLYGWCPERKIFLQHATSKQLLEEGLISEEHWNDYFKFTFVRNPWDRAYSDYLWILKNPKVKGSFKQYIHATGGFKEIFNNRESNAYRGDHKTPQLDFFDLDGKYKMDFIGHFENLQDDMLAVNNILKVKSAFNTHRNKSPMRKAHYSFFYNKSKRKLVADYYKKDIESLNYSFENNKEGLHLIKDLF